MTPSSSSSATHGTPASTSLIVNGPLDLHAPAQREVSMGRQRDDEVNGSILPIMAIRPVSTMLPIPARLSTSSEFVMDSKLVIKGAAP